MPQITAKFEKLMASVKEYISDAEHLQRIEDAFHYANKMHTNQYRKSGEPYIIHPLEVSYILTSLNTGPTTIVAGLLHDILEDTEATREDIVERFGEEVFVLVDGVTKLKKIKYVSKEQQQAKNHQKMFLAMAKDIRVIIIKLADRLHNMRTLNYRNEENQIKVSKETIEIYVPIAHRLGMYRLKSELEDRCFRYIDPDEYYKIAKLINKKQREREEDISYMIDEISTLLDSHNLEFEMTGRIKNIYSVHKKMKERKKDFSEIFDLLALRIIVKSESDCYHVLGLIHSKWRPIPKRFKDYIAMPKPNMYQSLHTTIITINGKIFEVQIRTVEMDQIAEYGIAAHWAYKENSRKTAAQEHLEMQQKLKWYKELIQYSLDSDTEEQFLDIIKEDIFSANVYVFTPNGDVLDFPAGATPLDFAYRIHSEVGNKTIGSIVNGKIVPLTYELKTGDIIEIKTSNQSFGPSEDWIKIVKTNHARNKIKQYFNKQNRNSLVEQGKEKVLKEFSASGLDLSKHIYDNKFIEKFQKYGVKTIEDLFYQVGKKIISSKSVVNRIVEDKEFDAQHWLEQFSEENLNDRLRKYRSSENGIVVEGLHNPRVKLAKCCNPIPGDEIMGYISKGNGIAVHRKECRNISDTEKQRCIEVYWDDSFNRKYEVDLKVIAFDHNDLLSETIVVINSSEVNLLSINANVTDDGFMTMKFKISVNDLNKLERLVINIKKIKDVYSVERIMH